jgi:hypothetical protein
MVMSGWAVPANFHLDRPNVLPAVNTETESEEAYLSIPLAMRFVLNRSYFSRVNVPRYLGTTEYTVLTVQGKRNFRTGRQWMCTSGPKAT